MAERVNLDPAPFEGWLLTDEEYRELVADSEFLQNLRDAGVDNWEGYDVARQMQGGDPDCE